MKGGEEEGRGGGWGWVGWVVGWGCGASGRDGGGEGKGMRGAEPTEGEGRCD